MGDMRVTCQVTVCFGPGKDPKAILSAAKTLRMTDTEVKVS
jgi:hypothetical protein